MRRLTALALLVFLLALPAFSEPITWDTDIDSVSMGVDGFGWDLMPVGIGFSYDVDFALFPVKHKAGAEFDIVVSFSDSSISEDYAWDTGTPRWSLTEAEAEEYGFFSEDDYSTLDYFHPYGEADISFSQGFWDNPNDPGDELFVINLGYYARYEMSIEELKLSRKGNKNDALFVDWYGDLRYPFSVGYVDAFPWLSGDRRIFSDYVYLKLELQMDRDTPKDVEAEHGLYGYLLFEYGPKWLFNDLDNGVQSSFFRARLYLEQNLELYTIYQDNGWNWTNMYVGHGDTLSYTWGDVIPYYKINTDRLEGYWTDSFWIHLNGPQFFTSDCFTYIELTLKNTLRFGNVQNESSKKTSAVELQSSVYAKFLIQLFGFIKLEYQFGYDFIQGIWPDSPEFWQYATIKFYISL